MIADKQSQPLTNLMILMFGIIILQALMPVVGRFISTFFTTYSLLLVVLLIIYYFLRWNFSEWFNKLLPIILVVIINLLYSITHGQSMVNTLYGALLAFCPVLIGLRIKDLPSRQLKRLFTVAGMGLCITAITSIYGLSTHPGAARIMATFENSNDPLLIQFEWLNIGGFAFTYILLTLYPMIIGYVREVHNKLWIKIIVIWILATYYLSAEYMTGLMGFTLLSSLWFVRKEFNYKRVLLVATVILAFFSLIKGPMASLLYDASASTTSSILHERFLYMADSLSGVENTSDVGSREDMLNASLYGFLRSPIFGNWHSGGGIGGHSFILDFLSLYGIIGVILLWKAYKTIFETYIAIYRNKPYYSYAVMSFVTAIILSTVNTGNHWFELTLLVPMSMKMMTIDKSQHI